MPQCCPVNSSAIVAQATVAQQLAARATAAETKSQSILLFLIIILSLEQLLLRWLHIPQPEQEQTP
jgi:hypothetical protein